MKVAYLLGSLNRGGTETLLLDVFMQSVNSPYQIIGIYRKDGELSDGFHSSKVSLFKIEPGQIWLFWLYIWRLRTLLKRENPDIVHTQQSLDTIYARLACLGLTIKVVQTFHAYDIGRGSIYRLLIRVSMIMSDLNVFVSETQRKYYELVYKWKPSMLRTVVYNGVDFEKFDCNGDNSIRNELNMGKKRLLLGMVGNFVNGRDQMTVCHFLDFLNSKHIDFIFLCIGKKDRRNPRIFNDCNQFCEQNNLGDKVKFWGSRPDVPAILPQLDAFIYSTDHDSFGLAVIEAIASGIPVFVNDWDVMKEITEDGKRTIMYRTKDENDLLNKFTSWHTQKDNYQASASDNALWARKTYSIQNHIERLYEVYCGIN